VWGQLTDLLRKPIQQASDFMKSIWDGIKNMAQGAWDAIKSGAGAVAGAIKGALNGVIGIVNTVIDGINTLIKGANSLPGPDLGLIPNVPRLARGGVIGARPGGTLALLAEAGRPERVEPLDSEGLSRRDRALISSLAMPGDIRVFIGDTELTALIREVQIDREVQVSRQLMGGRVLV
jgi:hypothetical protein